MPLDKVTVTAVANVELWRIGNTGTYALTEHIRQLIAAGYLRVDQYHHAKVKEAPRARPVGVREVERSDSEGSGVRGGSTGRKKASGRRDKKGSELGDTVDTSGHGKVARRESDESRRGGDPDTGGSV